MARLKDRLNAAVEGEASSDALLKEGGERFANVPVSAILPDPDQPRKSLGSLEDLKASIKEHGIIQPIVISPFGEEQFLIIAGERRFSAAKEMGLKTCPPSSGRWTSTDGSKSKSLRTSTGKNSAPSRRLPPTRSSWRSSAFLRDSSRPGLESPRRPSMRRSAFSPCPKRFWRVFDVRTPHPFSALEIAKQDSEEARDALWQAALNGSLTVKTARQKKERPATEETKPRISVPFRTKQATVTLVFAQDSVTPQEVVDALSQALREAKIALRDAATEAPSEPGA